MRRVGLLFPALTAVVLCGLIVAGCQGESESAKPPAPKPIVEIVAYYPFNPDHQYIVDYLKEFEKKYPGQVTVEVNDMQSPEGRKKWADSGLSCAGVFVNGSTRHEIVKDGKTETVDFLKRMDSFWSREDFETVVVKELVVKQLLEKAKSGK